MYTNNGNISLSLAVWLAADDGYDLKYQPNTLSATELLKPLKSLILSRRMLKEHSATVDIADLIPSRLGTAVHTAAEKAWMESRDTAFRNMNIPQKVIDRIYINAENQDDPQGIYIYLENRSSRKLGNYTISGKYDFVEQGRVKDIKTTKTYNWIMGSNDEKYMQQGSIYRWLNPDIITDDHMDVDFLFTDWSPLKSKVDNNYPPNRFMVRTLALMSLEETEYFILNVIQRYEQNVNLPQEDLPLCTQKELWMNDPKWAYYKDPSKLDRATRVFDNASDAQSAKSNNGGIGLIKKRESEPTFCKYCPALPICIQAANYINSGLLKI